MKRTEKGITLIALIITIVILIILAAVAIKSVSDQGIIEYANNAATSFGQAMNEEQNLQNGYVNYLKNEIK